MESNNVTPTCRVYLKLLHDERLRVARHERLYVRLSYKYGLEVWEIARLAGLTVDRVREIIIGTR